jgi:predicted DCC family thiol-disulfide oxidoreductase YuxK
MGARLIYDGACIFCDAYVRLLSLREAVGPVELINARSGDPRLRAYESAGYDLNEGMLFEYNGTIYFGADAICVLAVLSTPSSTFNRINGALLSKQRVETDLTNARLTRARDRKAEVSSPHAP